MRSALIIAFAFLLPSTAMAIPWFDQDWAEQLVAKEFPDYWSWLQQVQPRDQERYEALLIRGRTMAMQQHAQPELVDAWQTHFYALDHYRDLANAYNADSGSQTDALRLQLISAAEDVHLATMELFEARLYLNQAQADQLELKVADHELNFDVYAMETVERTVGPITD